MSTKRRQDVLTALREYCIAAELRAGDRLPPERDLAALLGCSRQTLRLALAELERAGDLWRHVGQGTFLGARPVGHRVRDTVLVQTSSPFHLMQVRLMLEPPAAALAATQATPHQIAYLADLITQGRCATQRSDCEKIDAAFHRGIAEITGNPVLLGLLDHLAHVRRHGAWQREWESTYRRLGLAEFTIRHSAQHDEVLACIRQGKPDDAAQAMRQHLKAIAVAMRLPKAS